MCCGKRRNNRAPALVVLGKMAHDKYQERKAARVQEQQYVFGRRRSPSPELLEDQANAEILEKAGISPPSYNEVMVNRANVPGARVSEREMKGEKGFMEDLVDLENGYDVANGMNSQHHRTGQAVIPGRPESQGVPMAQPPVYRNCCERKRAEKMARKAEKQAAKLARA